MDLGGHDAGPGLLHPLGQEHDPGAEQQREDAAHRPFEANVDDLVGQQVGPLDPARHGWIAIGLEQQPKGRDVHRQNAEHGDPAQDVERFYARGFGNGRNCALAVSHRTSPPGGDWRDPITAPFELAHPSSPGRRRGYAACSDTARLDRGHRFCLRLLA